MVTFEFLSHKCQELPDLLNIGDATSISLLLNPIDILLEFVLINLLPIWGLEIFKGHCCSILIFQNLLMVSFDELKLTLSVCLSFLKVLTLVSQFMF